MVFNRSSFSTGTLDIHMLYQQELSDELTVLKMSASGIFLLFQNSSLNYFFPI